jgi:hypothetical protein
MDLMNAPVFDERKERNKKNLLIGSLVLVVALILLTIGGYLAGHGWLFLNLPTEHRVNNFFNALEAKDYPKAFGIYNNDPNWQQHPDKYKDYPLERFTEDWTTESPVKAPITRHHVDLSRTDGEGKSSGTIVAVSVNGGHKLFMWVLKRDGTMTWPAGHEILY